MKQPELKSDIYNVLQLYNKEFNDQLKDYKMLEYYKTRIARAKTNGILVRYTIQKGYIEKIIERRSSYLKLLDRSIFDHIKQTIS
jgi:hypothetical protein